MFKVTIPGPVYVSAENLAGLLAFIGIAQVEVSDGETPMAAEAVATAPAQATTGNSQANKPRGRPAKTTPPPEAAETPPAAQQKPADLVGGAPDRAELLAKFTALVDSDYDKALEALTSFKVQRFSDIPDDQLGAFAAAIA